MAASKAAETVACPCCFNITLSGRGIYDICEVCFWEDDGTDDPEDGWGPNISSLGEARETYKAIGACDRNMLVNVRKPLPSELPAAPPVAERPSHD